MLPMSMDSPLLIASSDFSCVYLYLKTKNMHRYIDLTSLFISDIDDYKTTICIMGRRGRVIVW
jgi:hypothetical protein